MFFKGFFLMGYRRAIFAAKVKSRLMGIIAFMLRIKFYLRAYIPYDVKIIGLRRIYIGNNVSIGSGSWLNVNDRFSPGVAISIMNNSFIGQGNFFTSGKSIIIMDYCLTGKNCAFIGSSHNYNDPFRAYISTGTTLKDEIYVGVNCFFGFGSKVIGNVKVGHGSIVGAGAVVKENVPPFSLVVGSPARVIKRFNFKKGTWLPWPAIDYVEGPSESEYLSILKENGNIYLPISAASGSFSDLI